MIIELGTSCALCNEAGPLQRSHIIPAFVFRWLKKTSATGYFRNFINPNIRYQDGPKRPLLCRNCEEILSESEQEFARKIFHPYVSEELSSEGTATSQIAHFEYEDWLLRFVTSLHWRLISVPEDRSYLSEKAKTLLNLTMNIWRDSLLKKRNDTGENQTYLFFLQNISSGYGSLPYNISNNINYYLLRAIDFTPLISKKGALGIYSKIGPIAFFTSLKPRLLKNTSDAKIGMRGKIKTVQSLGNLLTNEFIFIDRPNDIFPKLRFSENQLEVIRNVYSKEKDRVDRSMTMRAHESDMIIKQLKEIQGIS